MKSEDCKKKVKQTCLRKFQVDSYSKTKEYKDYMKEWSLENYGKENFFQTECFKEKSKQTIREKYGKDYYLQTDDCRYKTYIANSLKSEEEKLAIKNKTKNTMFERYGAENYKSSEISKQREKKFNLEKYGVEHYFLSEDFKEKKNKHKEYLKNLEEKVLNLGYISRQDAVLKYGYGWVLSKLINPKYVYVENKAFISQEDLKEIENYCNRNLSVSNFEREVRFFLNSLNVEYLANSRKIISPYELDFYIPEKNLAIECNGTWTHSTLNLKDENYHLMKSKLCEEKGIRLIHISNWEWYNYKDACKSIINKSLDIFNTFLDANLCKINKIDEEEYSDFLKINSISYKSEQGNLIYGLYYNEELIQVYSFKELSESEVELVTVCNKIDVKIKNSFSLTINSLPKDIKYIYKTLDREKEDLNSYYKNGWEYIEDLPPKPYFYIRNERFSEEEFKNTKIENLTNVKFTKMYDSGSIKIKFTRRDLNE